METHRTVINNVKIEKSWKKVLKEEFHKEYFSEIKTALKEQKGDGKKIYPPGKLIFNAFNSCLLYTSPSPRDLSTSRMPSSA